MLIPEINKAQKKTLPFLQIIFIQIQGTEWNKRKQEENHSNTDR